MGTSTKEIEKLELSAPRRRKSKSWSFPLPEGENRKAGASRSQEEKIEKLELSAPRRRKSKSWSFPLPGGENRKAGAFRSQGGMRKHLSWLEVNDEKYDESKTDLKGKIFESGLKSLLTTKNAKSAD
jgi:hypothetical protein